MNCMEKETLWVIKIGSAMITNGGIGIDYSLLDDYAAQIANLQSKGYKIVVVSSGAVAAGMKRLGWSERPKELSELQAAAAVGQAKLVEAWQTALQKYRLTAAQVLLTHEDALDRTRYLNIRATLNALINHNIIPVINENDTVSYDEFCIGDNDTLGALVANLIEADTYIILTDQKGLYNKDPRKNSDAQLLSKVRAMDSALLDMASPEGGSLGKGGMYTKVKAAQKAATSGTETYIVYGKSEDGLLKVAAREEIGTQFEPEHTTMAAKKRWILNQAHVLGKVIVDQGAQKALIEHKKSLLPIGVIDVKGTFQRGDIISCVNEKGEELGRGLCNYNSEEVKLLLKTASNDIINKLGYVISEEIIHRNNWVSNH